MIVDPETLRQASAPNFHDTKRSVCHMSVQPIDTKEARAAAVAGILEFLEENLEACTRIKGFDQKTLRQINITVVYRPQEEGT